MTKINRHKLSPQDFKHIVEQAALLPTLTYIDSNGQTKSRKVTKKVLGKDLPQGTKVYGTKGGVKVEIEPKADEIYTLRTTEPLNVNHQVEMVSAFWKGGQEAVAEYVVRVNEVAARAEAKRKEASV